MQNVVWPRTEENKKEKKMPQFKIYLIKQNRKFSVNPLVTVGNGLVLVEQFCVIFFCHYISGWNRIWYLLHCMLAVRPHIVHTCSMFAHTNRARGRDGKFIIVGNSLRYFVWYSTFPCFTFAMRLTRQAAAEQANSGDTTWKHIIRTIYLPIGRIRHLFPLYVHGNFQLNV